MTLCPIPSAVIVTALARLPSRERIKDISLDKSFAELRIGDLERIELAMAAERVFKIEISDDAIAACRSPADLVREVMSIRQGRPSWP